ncbi:MAG TPA: ATP-binding protein, partial [Burkholderiaceae bacterium]|nr:ATP-binding protein [Burkholderiaceae bacterium]
PQRTGSGLAGGQGLGSPRDAVDRPVHAPSLQRRLNVGISVTVLGVAGVASVLAYLSAFDEAIEFQDDQLQEIAALVDRQGGPAAPAMLGEEAPDDDADAKVVVEHLVVGQALVVPAGFPHVPATLSEGFGTLVEADTKWRVYVRTLADRKSRIAVAQPTEFRDEQARHSAYRAVLPLAVLAFALPLLTWWIVHTLMLPLQRAAREIDGRDWRSLEPVESGAVPSELAPFVRSINGLLQRVQAAMAQQRRFIADAAHELRTPLTALSLQVERLESRELNESARGHVEDVRNGLERARVLSEQLLSLARIQNQEVTPTSPTWLLPVAVSTLEELVPIAFAKNVDLGLVERCNFAVAINETEMRVLLRNLVDNAIRHTPPSGQVDVALSLRDGVGLLRVSDSGPGIAPEDRQRALQPFHRLDNAAGPGAGLGLSIVQTITQRHGLALELDHARSMARRGLRVEVRFPQPIEIGRA